MDAIGKLTGGIAHDFNNLLAAVLGGLALLEKRVPLRDEDVKILGMTKRAAEQGSELIRRLLAFARRQALEPKAIEPKVLREAVSDLLTHTLGGLVELDWHFPDDIPQVFADQAQLELALVNLIINARDAMPSGGTVTVTAEGRTVQPGERLGLAAGAYVRMCVADTGSGIMPEHLEKVLEPFFTTKEVGKGSGLGLPMVYGFAEQSNGVFKIESTVGQGTVAQLWLPAAEPHTENKAVAVAREGKPEQIAVGPLKILLVDDHPEVRRTTAALLEEFGHVVIEAQNGTDALAALAEDAGDCDLLISDYAMPHVSGTQLVRVARQRSPDLSALIITGYAETEAVRDLPDRVEILLKPFTPSALLGALARTCAGASFKAARRATEGGRP